MSESVGGSFMPPIWMVQAMEQMLKPPGWDLLTEAEKAERRDAYRLRQEAKAANLRRFRAEVAAITEANARALLDLHSEDEYGDCGGCDYGGYEAEAPAWPCRTTITVAGQHGVLL